MIKTAFRTLITVLFPFLLASCPVSSPPLPAPPLEEYKSWYHLDVTNRTSQNIVLSLDFEGGRFYVPSETTGSKKYNYDKEIGSFENSGKIELSQGATYRLAIVVIGGSSSKLQNFMKVSFYRSSSDTTPSVSYDYTNSKGGSSYDKKGIWVKTDGSRENLFEKSETRPFYFQYDYDFDPDHMYITSAP